MLLIIALVIASLFVYFLKDKLKQYPNIFYIGAAVVTIVIFSLRTVAMPQFVRQNIVHYGGNSGAFAQPDLRHDVF